MPAARYSKGDIISVQIGVRDVNTAASPHAPGWSRYYRRTHCRRRRHHHHHHPVAPCVRVREERLTTRIFTTINPILGRPIELAKRPLSPGESVAEKYDVHPYVIFFKNFTMVHRPMVRTTVVVVVSLMSFRTHARCAHADSCCSTLSYR
jgi:hypothetical protein